MDSTASKMMLGVGLALAAFALYYPVLSHDFLNYDDDRYVKPDDINARAKLFRCRAHP